jgi:hypothetical protein
MSSDDMTTRPTIETVLERINTLAIHIDGRFDLVEKQLADLNGRVAAVEQRMVASDQRMDALEQKHSAMEKHLRRIDIRLDRIEGMVLMLRSGFDDLRDQLAERIPEIR